MSYTDVTKPVIVNVSLSASFSVENWLRRMAIISAGETNLAVGEYKLVDSSTYGNFVKKDTEAEKNCASFFAYAGNKAVVLLEAGSASLETQCNAIKSFLISEDCKVFNILVPSSFFYVKAADKTFIVSMASQTLVPTEEAQTANIVFSENIDVSKVTISGVDATKLNVVLSQNAISYNLLSGQTLDAAVEATLTYTIDGAATELGKITFNEAGGAATSSISFNKTIAGKTDNSFVKLAAEWSDISKENIFLLPYPQNEDPAASSNWQNFKGLASILPVANNCQTSVFETAAMVLGKTANSIFDISETNPASPLNYKVLSGSTPQEYNSAMKQNLIQAPITFVSSLAGQNVILSGLCADGKPWEWYYYWYLTEFRVYEKITTLLLNGANNPVSAVKFNQDGIDTIHSNIVAVLDECKDLGVITDFAQSYDSATGALSGSGEIVVPDYYEYIAAYPQDYANEVLKGISCYIQIGKFIRQVQWNVTLGS